MKMTEVNKILNKGFTTYLKKFGFKKTKYRFIKNEKGFTIDFGYSIVNYYSFFPTMFSYKLSWIKYDKLYSAICDVNNTNLNLYSRGIRTLYELGGYDKPEYTIKTADDAHLMVNEVNEYMNKVALPYLESISNVESLEQVVNSNPTRETSGEKGLILARLVDNPNYEKLKITYRNFLMDENWAEREHRDNLEKVIIFLDNHTKEELKVIANS